MSSSFNLTSLQPKNLGTLPGGIGDIDVGDVADDVGDVVGDIADDVSDVFVGLYDDLGDVVIPTIGDLPLPDVTAGSDAARSYLDDAFGVPISNYTYTGSQDAVFRVTDFTIPGTGISWDGGILLTSGRVPNLVNTYTGYSFSHGEGGDSDLAKVVLDAFSGAGETKDAAFIEFTFFVEDPAVKGLRFDIVFGSEEYSEYSDTSFVDVAAVWLDDDLDGTFEVSENKAVFDGNSKTPLSVISENVDNFVDNEDGKFPIEWDGFGALSVRPAVRQGENKIKIGIADTGDRILDSGLFVTNFQFLTTSTTTSDEIFRIVTGEEDSNDLVARDGREELQLADGIGSVKGLLGSLNGDIITGFSDKSELIVEAQDAVLDVVDVTENTATVNVDEDGDGTVDGRVVLEGDFKGATFSTKSVSNGVGLSVDLPEAGPPQLPGLSEGTSLSAGEVNGMFRTLAGDGTKTFEVTLDKAMSEAAFDNALGVYEVTSDGDIEDARLLFQNVKSDAAGPVIVASVEAGHSLGFFLVSDGAAWAEGLGATDVLSFVDETGDGGSVDDGGDLRLAVNGNVASDVTVFHSYQAALNADGKTHVVSGETAGVVQIGFEDLMDGGDMDFQDVVFQVIEL